MVVVCYEKNHCLYIISMYVSTKNAFFDMGSKTDFLISFLTLFSTVAKSFQTKIHIRPENRENWPQKVTTLTDLRGAFSFFQGQRRFSLIFHNHCTVFVLRRA